MRCKFVSEFGYVAAFLNVGSSNRVMLKTTPNFALPPVKIRGGWGRSEICGSMWINVDQSTGPPSPYDRTSGIHLMAIHCAAAEHGGLIKKKRTKERKFISKACLRLPTYLSGGLKDKKKKFSSVY